MFGPSIQHLRRTGLAVVGLTAALFLGACAATPVAVNDTDRAPTVTSTGVQGTFTMPAVTSEDRAAPYALTGNAARAQDNPIANGQWIDVGNGNVYLPEAR